jgi:hypothetical protein
MKKPVLHELLAVEQSLAATSNNIIKDTIKNLGERRALYDGMVKEHEIYDDDKQHLKQATEYKEVQSTVDEQLDYMANELARYYDCVYQKEEANQRAKADIIINGELIAANVPAIVLLGMENKLTGLLAVYNAIPTLDAAKSWVRAEDYAKKGVFKTQHQEERLHKITDKDFQIVAPATKEHPAQVKEVTRESTIGKYVINYFSGALTSLEKAERLQRLTALIRAVKEARQRANNTEVVAEKGFGKALFNYINS